MKRSGKMWVRDEDLFMPRYFEHTGDQFQIEHLKTALEFCGRKRVAVDVGAHYGSWTRYLSKQFNTVLAYEPVPATFECLAANVSGLRNVHIFNKAVGDAPRFVSVGIGKMYHHPGMETVTQGSGSIEMLRLDDVPLSALDFLKIDVEGFEFYVLQGARETLRKFQPVVILEENVRGYKEHRVPSGRSRRFLEAMGAELLLVVGEDYIFGWLRRTWGPRIIRKAKRIIGTAIPHGSPRLTALDEAGSVGAAISRASFKRSE